ncbi:unnamed protein product, partial [Arabidopsis halleri]
MANNTSNDVGSESHPDSPELSFNPPPVTTSAAPSLDSRVENIEREMLVLREAVQQILQNQIYGSSRDGRDSTPTVFTSSSSGPQFQAIPVPSSEGNNEMRFCRVRLQTFRCVKWIHALPHHHLNNRVLLHHRLSSRGSNPPRLSSRFRLLVQGGAMLLNTPDPRLRQVGEGNNLFDGSSNDLVAMVKGAQVSSIDEYKNRFEELVVELPHVTADILESAFLNELRRSLKDQVVRCHTVSLTDIVEIIRMIESQERDNLSYQVRSQARHVQLVMGVRVFGSVRNTNPCRHCGDKWFPGHRCKQQKLKSLEVADEEDQEGPSGEALDAPELTEDQVEEEGFVTLSLGSMSDLSRKKSMKLRGYIGRVEVVVLVDSRATCNFINERLVRAMGWPITETRCFGVRVGGGRIIRSRGKCVNVPLEIQGIEITDDFLLFDLGELDVVLRFTWEHVSLHSMERVIKYTGEAYLLELYSLFENQAPTKEIQRVLEQYQKV